MWAVALTQPRDLMRSLTITASTTRPLVLRQCFKTPTAAIIRLTAFLHSLTILPATLTPRLVAPHSPTTPLEPLISPWALLLAPVSPTPTTLFVLVRPV